ncbi:MAG: zinc ABC transporter substrate-binding protein [Thermodesulfobacteriota bacterium]|nr:zinc ABC transporter substrate-binding protein [Thermodesulfobacteriota bacterium]
MITRTAKMLMLLLICCGSAHAQHQPLNIVVSVAPQKYLVKKLTGNLAQVSVMVEPGQNPATWEPSARRMVQIANADVLFCIGVPFEKVWLPKLQQSFPGLTVADPRTQIAMLPITGHTHTTTHQHHEDIDPHIWLDPLRDIQMAENMTATLCELDPIHRQSYQQRLEKLRREFTQLHLQIAAMLQPYAGCHFMVFHPSWGYFARRYQLKQLAIELSGKEPRGAKLAEITTIARHNNISAIFVQQQFSQKAARAIADQISAQIIILDPLAEDLPHTLLTTAQQLQHTLE